MTKLLLVALLLVAFGCSIRPANRFDIESQVFPDQNAETSALPKLILEAHPRVGFAPLRVNVRARLQNVTSNDPIFGCLWESWTFGDGAVSAEKNNCTGSSKIELSYEQEHVYDKPGVYLVQFVLGDLQVLSNPLRIKVLGTDLR